MLQAQSHQIGWFNPQLAAHALDLTFFVDGYLALHDSQREQAAEERKPLFVRCSGGEVTGDEKVVGSTEKTVAGLGQRDDEQRLVRRQIPFFGDQLFHDAGFFSADVLIGVRDAAEQIGELGEIPRTLGLESIECLDQLAQRVMRCRCLS